MKRYSIAVPKKLESGSPPQPTSIDPIALDEQTIFGLDPAVHWVHLSNQNEQFPEIVVEISKHLNDRDWLVKFVERLGYNSGIYDAKSNPKGIFARRFIQKTASGMKVAGVPPGMHGLRFFVLRAAGVKNETCAAMFMTSTSLGTANVAQIPYKELLARRQALVAQLKKP